MYFNASSHAGFGKRGDPRGNRLFDVIVAVSGPQSDPDHFE
jgi:hypothetical protein